MAIERIAYYEYSKEDEVTDKWLNINDFSYDRYASDKDSPAYSTRFPVYKYEGMTVLDGYITIWPKENNRITVNCYEHNTKHYFARFYYWEYGEDDKYMNVINEIVLNKLKSLGINVVSQEDKA